ncbi:unnamed protein product [Ascophyllum nodosum]
MSRLTRDGTAVPVSRDQILRHERGQGNINFPCSANHEQNWQPHPVDPYSCYMCDHTRVPLLVRRGEKQNKTQDASKKKKMVRGLRSRCGKRYAFKQLVQCKTLKRQHPLLELL